MRDSPAHAPTGRDDFVSTTEQWFASWMEHFAAPESRLWEARRFPNLKIPCELKRVGLGPLQVRVVQGASNSHTPRFDVLGSALPIDAIQCLLEEHGASMARFDFVSEQSLVMQAARDSAGRLLVDIDECEVAPYVDCSGSWSEYWNARGSVRETWARRERQLINKMGARFECLRDWNAVAPRLDSILAVESSGWKGRQGTAIDQSPQTLGFYTRLIREWAEQGILRLYLLTLGERPIAFEIDALHRRRLNMFKVGYAEDLSKVSPGQVLRMQVLKEAFADPEVDVFDMFGPAGHGKMQWATGTVSLRTVRFMRRTLLGRLAYLRYGPLPRIRARLRALAQESPQARAGTGSATPVPGEP